MQGMPNFKIPAFAEAALRRQANAKGMTNARMSNDLTLEIWTSLNFRI
jgi:hypothetical protein